MTASRRQRVMSPQTRAALGLPASPRSRPRPPPSEPADTPETLAALTVTLRVQRRLAVRTMVLLLGGLILLPVVLNADWLGRVRVVGVPLLWLLLGAGIYPVLLLIAHRHRRAVDRLEAALAAREVGPAN